ncbi:MAG: Gfo/Idh/MocA family oxidoreductase [Planctomycetaceae bacterium]|nr:Gfo/Idh/MocA family oxidoreductase [Planctomycetaceae bacterium]
MPRSSSRREFMKTSAALGAAVYVGHGVALGQEEKSPNAKVRYACIGVGGKGASDSADAASHGEIVAICDVDQRTLRKTAAREGYREAETFTDFREMFEKMADKIDAVTVSTPDHCHAPAAAMAMNLGKHCFTQKPLTHTVWEARRLQQIAKESGVKTMMGNQGTATDGLRRAAAILKAGHLGKIQSVHVFTNRPIWAQGGPRPKPTDKPSYLDC